MIFGHLANFEFGAYLPPALVAAIKFARETEMTRLPLGRLNIDGSAVFAEIAEYEPKERHEKSWEAHRKYHDLQIVLAGSELVGVANIKQVRELHAYDEVQDVAFYSGDGDFFVLRPGYFVIFAPSDAHMPGVSAGTPGLVRKAVIKVKV